MAKVQEAVDLVALVEALSVLVFSDDRPEPAVVLLIFYAENDPNRSPVPRFSRGKLYLAATGTGAARRNVAFVISRRGRVEVCRDSSRGNLLQDPEPLEPPAVK